MRFPISAPFPTEMEDGGLGPAHALAESGATSPLRASAIALTLSLPNATVAGGHIAAFLSG